MPIGEDMNSTIGLVTIAAAQLEDITAVLARELIDDDPRVWRAAMGGDVSFSRAATRIVPLAEARDLPRDLTQQLKWAVIGAQKAMEQRNALLHSLWMSDNDGTPIQTRRRKGGEAYYVEVTVEDMTAVFMAVSDAQQEMRRLWLKVAGHFGRAEVTENGRPLRLPNRWPDSETLPSPSRTWTAEDRWVRGLAEWVEVEAEREQRADALGVDIADLGAPNCPNDLRPMEAGDGGWICRRCGLVRPA